MTILVIGATGKTGKPLAKLLHDANYPLLLTSRSGVFAEPYRGVKFDWHDKTTHENPFNADQNIDRVYMIGAEALDMTSFMGPFIDYAVTKGVKRFVLLSATTTPKGSPAMGGVHQYLEGCGVDYCVLRPTWFMGTFQGRKCGAAVDQLLARELCCTAQAVYYPRSRYDGYRSRRWSNSVCFRRRHRGSGIQSSNGRENSQR
jgi:uncharacterized protein YbjT (DUF2867 family)